MKIQLKNENLEAEFDKRITNTQPKVDQAAVDYAVFKVRDDKIWHLLTILKECATRPEQAKYIKIEAVCKALYETIDEYITTVRERVV